MSIQPGQPVRAAGVILFLAGPPRQFLLMEHANRWDLPKGHCEPEESFREAALREMEEETGIPAQDVTLDPQFLFETQYPVTYKRHPGETFLKQLRIYLGWLELKPQVTVTEHIGHRWFQWSPPHQIEQRTIDPLLEAVSQHWQ